MRALALAAFAVVCALLYLFYTEHWHQYFVFSQIPRLGLQHSALLLTTDDQHLEVFSTVASAENVLTFYCQGKGATDGHKTLARYANALQTGGTWVTFNYRGAGGSSGTPTLTNTVCDAREVLAYALTKHKPARVNFYGKSLGAMVILKLLESEAQCCSCVLETPFVGSNTLKAPALGLMPEAFPIVGPLVSPKSVLVTLAEHEELFENDLICATLRQLGLRFQIATAASARHAELLVGSSVKHRIVQCLR